MCVYVWVCVCRGEEYFEMKAQRDSQEERQGQQVVLGTLLLWVKEAFRVNRSISVRLGEDYPFQIV